jgi:nuclear pore complex protein Nup205
LSRKESNKLFLGKAKISGQILVINESFAAEAIFLSESLDVSELYCAELLEVLTRLDHNRSPEQRVEKAIHLFHSRRNSVLMILNLIITGAYQEEQSGKGDLLKTFVKGQLFQGEALPLSSGRRGGYGEKLLEEMDRVGQVVTKVTAMIRDAKSDTNLKGRLNEGLKPIPCSLYVPSSQQLRESYSRRPSKVTQI